MKKKYISVLIFILTIVSTTFAAEFYDTLDTKYEGAVEALYELGIVDGISEGVYSPNTYVTRAQLAKLLTEAYDHSIALASINNVKYTDVKKGDWFYNYVGFASGWGIITGYEDGTFKPNKNVTYAEAVTMIIRALGYDNIKPDSEYGWEYNYIKKMREIQLNKNVPIEDASELVNRGDIAILIWNMLSQKSYIEIEENKITGLTWADVGAKLIDRVYENYTTIDNAKITGIKYNEEKCYIELDGEVEYEIEQPIKIRMLGASITALYNKETKILVAMSINSSNKFDEGYVQELKEIYKINSAKSYGTGNDYAYVYFKDDGTIERVVFIDLGTNMVVINKKYEKEKIEVEEEQEDGTIKKVKKDGEEYILINDTNKIYIESEILLDENNKTTNWKNLPVDSVLTWDESRNCYIYSTKKIEGKIERYTKNGSNIILNLNNKNYKLSEDATYLTYEDEQIAKDNKNKIVLKEMSASKIETYKQRNAVAYISALGSVAHIYYEKDISEEAKTDLFGIVAEEPRKTNGESRYMISLYNSDGKKSFYLDNTLKIDGLEKGTFILYNRRNSIIESYNIISKTGKIHSKSNIEYNVKETNYQNNKIGKYTITENTQIYLITQKYEINTEMNLKEAIIERQDIEILNNIADEKIHIIYDNNSNAETIMVVKELNKLDYFYARVKDIYEGTITTKDKEEKKVMKIDIIPIGQDMKATYIINQLILECSAGDLIAYTIKDQNLIIKEVYRKSSIGYEKDLIVDRTKSAGKIAITTNGEELNLEKPTFKTDSKKEYKWEDYSIILAKVRDWDGYMFVGEEFIETKDLTFKVNDRIAIDELEGIIVVYRGYEG